MTECLPTTACAATATAEATARAAATATETALALAIAAAEPATAATANAGGRGTRFVHDHGATIKVLPVRGRDGRRCFRIGAHFDKAEALATTGHTINDHIR
jgi:hypothetical protein